MDHLRSKDGRGQSGLYLVYWDEDGEPKRAQWITPCRAWIEVTAKYHGHTVEIAPD